MQKAVNGELLTSFVTYFNAKKWFLSFQKLLSDKQISDTKWPDDVIIGVAIVIRGYNCHSAKGMHRSGTVLCQTFAFPTGMY